MKTFEGLFVLVLGAFGVIASGCAPQLTAVSTPPPTRDAEHTLRIFSDDVVHIEQGVAIAFDCNDGFTGDPCRNAEARVDDPKIAKVYRAHLERQKSPWGNAYDVRQRAGFVLVGTMKGRTRVRIATDGGPKDVTVIVE